ncbi:DUF5079 family protein [Staphylococcus arlettae]|uniref:DUF5079 family protein n=1 Tax=Staphylococcus arlettae TaxID=29378 RepID=UPI000D19B5DC|nr:DUF5079 family protein [Staphylococcus arlettae]PTH34710.1 DUF5079 domain-containing protein [Staphylococcus arlettae]PTH50965.1 DUF5079 domain-containing protein [Staphylococcus arlettae]PTH56157.1 DUF5079 domain-containing protein [Staphylococcus arlettae]PUZ31065.1 DUF5079 domain-containing protein [Staphylococcus arlettae]RIM57106.1 DUF5079 family protein [Staphylococcus arlettae]
MNLNNEIDELRKPATQIISLFALFMILFTGITLFNGLEYRNIPFYLKSITVIELLIIIISLLQFIRFFNFEKRKYKNNRLLKNYAKFLTVINVVSTYNAAFAFCNLFYFMAIQNNIDLYHYWLLSTTSMFICFTLWTVGTILLFIEMPKLEQYVNGKVKTLLGLGLTLIGSLLYVERIVEYILVPNIADSKFLVSGSILVLLGIQLVAFEYVRKYADFKILVLKE